MYGKKKRSLEFSAVTLMVEAICFRTAETGRIGRMTRTPNPAGPSPVNGVMRPPLKKMPTQFPPGTTFWDAENVPFAYIPGEGWFSAYKGAWDFRGEQMPDHARRNGADRSSRVLKATKLLLSHACTKADSLSKMVRVPTGDPRSPCGSFVYIFNSENLILELGVQLRDIRFGHAVSQMAKSRRPISIQSADI